MTLIELLIALTVFGVVITTALAFLARQNSAFQESLTRLGALRNVRYALAALEQDLQTVGTNVPNSQPHLLYAGGDVVVFSADYATNVAGDPFAVFHDPDLPSGQVTAPTSPFTVPTTSTTVADSTYMSQGVTSPAEIISFFFDLDTTTARPDDFALYRQVNAAAPERLARNILRIGDTPFFSYQRELTDTAGAVSFAFVPSSDLPMWHSVHTHLAPGDTGSVALADSVRAVRLSMSATNGLSGAHLRRVDATRVIPLPNSGLRVLSTCGSGPLLGVMLDATPGTNAQGEPIVTLAWTPAIDEVGGEADVVRYVIWRRDFGMTTWGDPYRAIPAGAASYAYEDATVQSGGTYEFAIAAQDCTPTLSARALSSPVTIP